MKKLIEYNKIYQNYNLNIFYNKNQLFQFKIMKV